MHSPALPNLAITWQGVLLALVGQWVVVRVAAVVWRLSRAETRRLVRAVLVADVGVVTALVVLAVLSFHLNRGSHAHRVWVILVHLGLAAAMPWVIWTLAVSKVTRRSAVLPAALLLAVTALGLALPGVRRSISKRPAQVTRLSVLLPELPLQLNGTRVIVVGDIHLGRYVSAENAWARLEPLRGLKADLVVFTGDLVTANPSLIPAAAELLDEFCPKVPRFAVLGNHDRWADQQAAVAALAEHGFTVIVNDRLHVTLKGADLWLVGVNDYYTAAARLDKAFAGVPEAAFVILLSHSPDIVREPRARRADLILSGHTHGGQVVLPLIGVTGSSSWYGPRYASGLHRLDDTFLFVTRGLGEVGVPLRMYCEPEIAVLELRREP